MNSIRVIGEPNGVVDLAGLALRTVRGVRLLDGTIADLVLDGRRIAGVVHRPVGAAGSVARVPEGTTTAAAGVVDLDASGWRVLPAAAEPHAHLDKALTAPRVDPAAGRDLVAAIESWKAIQPTIDGADLRTRGRAAVERYVANGITTIRTHVDLARTGDPLRGVDAMLALRETLAGHVTLQVCLLAGAEAHDDAIEEAVRRGIDVVGGCPHLAPDPRAETRRMLDVAERTGLPVDLHTDEQTDLGPAGNPLDLVDLAQQVIARGLQQRVTASHCVRLGSLPPAELAGVLDVVARAGIGIVTLPITNLYLQGWDAAHLVPRGIAPLRAILDAGVPLAAGADNLRDPFNPVGRADPFETTSLLVAAAHLPPRDALDAVTTGARAVLGVPPAAARPGDDADLVLVPDVDLGDVVAGAVGSRVVVHGGRVVADTRVRTALDLPQAPSTTQVEAPPSAVLSPAR